MKQLTKEALACMLEGNEYLNEITKEQEQSAKENNLLVIFGHSDDGVQFRGVVNDEEGAYGGTTLYLLKKGEQFCIADDGTDRTYRLAHKVSLLPHNDDFPVNENARVIEVKWGEGAKTDPVWQIETTLPHVKFVIREDGEPFSEGIVIDMDEIV